MATIRISKPRFRDQDLRLLDAARLGDPHRVKILIDEGLDVNDKDANGVTALIVASSAGNLEAVRELLRAGALLEPQDNLGYNTYHAAMFHGDLNGVTLEPFDKILELVKIE